MPEPLVPTDAHENGAAGAIPCVPGRLVWVRLELFDIDVAGAVEALIIASIVTVTELPGSRHDTFTVTTCPTVELPVEKADSLAQVPPCVLETLTVPDCKFASRVSVSTISKAVVALLPTASLVKVIE